jgi:uncharacterized protein (TIGR02646 family)
MIHVPRDRVTPPKDWQARAEHERATAERAVAAGSKPGFQLYRLHETRDLLRELFHGKCAFCESAIVAIAHADVEHFRPKSRAIGLDGVVESGYWWLAAEWANLYLSCGLCNRNKANRFPVAGPRAREPGEEKDEAALILDPCADDPERELVFGDDGLVASLPPDPATSDRLAGHDRGQITIDVLGLNRLDLVERRRVLIANLRLEFQVALVSGSPAEHLLTPSPDAEYLAVRRQLDREFRQQLEERGFLAAREGVPDIRVGEVEKQAAFERLEAHEVRVKQSSIEDPADPQIFSHAATLARVEIENFRCIEELAFDFPTGAPERLGWKLLLGENGTGKSSVLQAVALTLMGERRAAELELDPSRLLSDGAEQGRVGVYLSTEREPLELYLSRAGISYPADRSNRRTFVLGIGAARWLPRPGAMPPDSDPQIRARNLFNPFVPLTDALSSLEVLHRTDPVGFKRAEHAVLAMLDRTEGDSLDVDDDDRVVIRPADPDARPMRLDALSDGYQSMLAIAGEICEITAPWSQIPDAEGVVIVDEIGAHLHPRWKMRVVESMRRAFPRMQFLASTHDPLCLRGLGQGEILVLQEDDDGDLIALDDLPGTEDMRVDQLLTSKLFGLGSTLDPALEADLSEYYSLLGRRQLTPDEQARLEKLRQSVGSRGILGDTPRDQAIYQVIDEYLADEEQTVENEWVKVSDETKRRVASLLKGEGPEP